MLLQSLGRGIRDAPNGPSFSSWVLWLERIAGGDRTRVKSCLEPARPLLRSPVGKRFRNNISARPQLQPIVSDHARRAEGLIDVARIENAPIMIGEHSRKTIRLELHAHGRVIRVVAFRLRSDAEEILYM